MSKRLEHHLLRSVSARSNFQGLDLSSYSEEELRQLWNETLEEGIHGICFSLYEDGQKPGDHISAEQVERRIQIIKPHAKWVRSFSCIEGNENIARQAKKYGMKTLVGAWLGDDEDMNEKEIQGLIQLAKEGCVDIAAVGNEVLYRRDLTEDQLLNYIYRVKEALPGIPVGYVDAYYEFTEKPRVTQACDVILANCYPYWEGTPYEHSMTHMQQMVRQAQSAAPDKKVVITECGWPSRGENFEAAVPSEESAMKYFIQSNYWAKKQGVEMFYFSSFDESWKTGAEGDVGAYWGLWDKHENLKFPVRELAI